MPQDKIDIDELVELFLEDELDEISTTAGLPGYNSPYAFTGRKPKYEKMRKKIAKAAGYTLAKKKKKNKKPLGEAMKHSEIISEIFGLNYPSFKKDETKNARQKVNGAIKEINKRLFEIERIIGRATKLKKEAGVSKDNYWKSSTPRMRKIAERLLKVSNKLRELSA
tara:strand:- start:54 stop:554 length:501 start_codon:yes stop_codon:yes gene_type:complete